MTPSPPPETPPTNRSEILTAALLIACVVLIGAWQFMANHAGPDRGFTLSASDFAGFTPPAGPWNVESRNPAPSPEEPNILAYRFVPLAQTDGTPPPVPAIVRLVHGYNMPDCMRIKGYQVQLVSDRREGAPPDPGGAAAVPVQIWRVVSSTGDAAVWITSLLDAGDFHATDLDVRSMSFPKVGIPDEPQWVPRGVTLQSLRHPVRNFKRLVRARWNASRCDLLTFLKLRRPAWASDEVLTLVSVSSTVSPNDEPATTAALLRTHAAMCQALGAWRRNHLGRAP